MADSKAAASSPGIPYHVLVSPQCTTVSGENEPLTIVDTVRVMILVVPAKRGKEHADVDPGYRHARDVRLDVPQQTIVS
jgi:hypothetical protein